MWKSSPLTGVSMLEKRSRFRQYLTARIRSDVSDHQIWIPISDLPLEEDFQFGLARAIPTPRGFLDGAERSALSRHSEHRDNIVGDFLRIPMIARRYSNLMPRSVPI
ncbi:MULTISPECIES: hypothetical protein [unclassified Bradyrhizobium]